MSHEVEQVEEQEPQLNTFFEDTLARGKKIDTSEAIDALNTLDALLHAYRFTPLNPMGWRLKDFEVAQVMLPPITMPHSKDVKLPDEKEFWVFMLRKNSKNIMCGITLFLKSPAVILVDLQRSLA